MFWWKINKTHTRTWTHAHADQSIIVIRTPAGLGSDEFRKCFISQIEMWCGRKVTAVPFSGNTFPVLHARHTRSPRTSQRRRHSLCTLRAERKIPDGRFHLTSRSRWNVEIPRVHHSADGSQKNDNHLHEIGVSPAWGWGACPIKLVDGGG